jgi:hypothetical protein
MRSRWSVGADSLADGRLLLGTNPSSLRPLDTEWKRNCELMTMMKKVPDSV